MIRQSNKMKSCEPIMTFSKTSLPTAWQHCWPLSHLGCERQASSRLLCVIIASPLKYCSITLACTPKQSIVQILSFIKTVSCCLWFSGMFCSLNTASPGKVEKDGELEVGETGLESRFQVLQLFHRKQIS